MLILSRKAGESICLPGTNTTITIHRLSGGRVVLAIDAPREVAILRGELVRLDDGDAPPNEMHTQQLVTMRPR
ncbi:carbon storage regulator [Rhodopirellula europaea]|uniref:Translational regulator CsrA n=1 Tax=Rhodopirellula europaea SH398 TaxID=1263868 RepID=M5SAL8_9BACT|nr:carbon storage regulator [Rhodopirellula europaea]EMI24707.1 Carbon storage regulator [Rhodopirellula europaea SH398]